MQRSGVLVVLCLVLAVVPACKKASESAAEKAAERAIERATGNKADVDVSGGGVKITGKEGDKSFSYEASGTGGVALPKSFPEDVPRYPGATVLASMSQGDAASMVTFQTGDPAGRISDYYAAQLRDGDWEIVSEVTMPEIRMISAKKAGREVSVTVGSDQGKSTITVVYNAGKG